MVTFKLSTFKLSEYLLYLKIRIKVYHAIENSIRSYKGIRIRIYNSPNNLFPYDIMLQ